MSQPSVPGVAPPLSAFIGRARETAELVDLLEQRRLVTLVGPGGIGKTRLAMEIAGAVADRMSAARGTVDLAEVPNRDDVEVATAAAFGLSPGPEGDAASVLQGAFSRRPAVLVLDNVESLPKSGRSVVGRMIRQVPGLHVLATGRTPMHVEGEQEYVVGPLDVPPGGESAGAIVGFDAVRLFVDRARLVDRGFGITEGNAPRIAAICRRLEGLPLAIELAAARLKLVSIDELEASLDDALSLTASDDRPMRHRTLRDTIAWSVRNLDPEPAALLHHVAVFSGSFDLAAVRAVVPADVNGSSDEAVFALVDNSLLGTVPADGPRRYVMLDAIRQFATEAQPVADDTRGRHAAHFAAVAEAGAARSADGPPIADRANFRAALAWSADHDDALLARMAAALATFWRDHSEPVQARDWLAMALDRRDRLDAQLTAAVLGAAAEVDLAVGDVAAAEVLGREALRAFEALGDVRGVVNARRLLGAVASFGPDGEAARGIVELEAALRAARQLGDRALLIEVLGTLGAAHRTRLDKSARYLTEALNLARETGDVRTMALALSNLGWNAMMLQKPELAAERLRESVDLFRESGDGRNEAWARLNLAEALLSGHRLPEAIEAFRRGLDQAEAVGSAPEEVQALETGAELREALGDAAGAVRSRATAERLRTERRMDRPPGEREIWDLATGRLRRQLGPAAYRLAWAEGGESAVAEAVAELRVSLDGREDPTTPRVGVAAVGTDGSSALTVREREVLKLVAQGLSDGEISTALGISPKTASVHVSNIKRKLGVETRLQIALRARGETG